MKEDERYVWQHTRCGTMTPGLWRDPSPCHGWCVNPVEYKDEVKQYKLTEIKAKS